MSETKKPVMWEIADGVLHVRSESDLHAAEAHIPICEWAIDWSAQGCYRPDLKIGHSRLTYYGSLNVSDGAGQWIHFGVGDLEMVAIWQAVTGAPIPTEKPQMCPTHKVEPLTKEGSLWRCAGCDREAAPKAEAGTEERIAS